eukprot:ANDGO_01548.mRNA.1 Nicastrin
MGQNMMGRSRGNGVGMVGGMMPLLVLLCVLCVSPALAYEKGLGRPLFPFDKLYDFFYDSIPAFTSIKFLSADEEVAASFPDSGRLFVLTGRISVVVSSDEFQNRIESGLGAPLYKALVVRSDQWTKPLYEIIRSTCSDAAAAEVAVVVLATDETPPLDETPFSCDALNPNSAFGVPSSKSWMWNPGGTNHCFQSPGPFVIYVSDAESRRVLRERADENDRKLGDWHGEFPWSLLPLWAVDVRSAFSGYRNAHRCLKLRKCRPVGDFSVLAGLPGAKVERSSSQTVRVLSARLDSTTEAPWFSPSVREVNGRLAVALTAAFAIGSALQATPNSMRNSTQFLFWFPNADTYGYAGTYKWLADAVVPHVTSGSWEIDRFVDLGSLAFESSDTMFVHAMERSNPSFADTFAQSAHNMMASSAHSLKNVNMSSVPNGVLPPSVLHPLLLTYPSLANRSLVLTDYDTVFSNRYYHSVGDRAFSSQPLNSTLLCDAVRLAVHAMLVPIDGEPSPLKQNVSQYISCALVDSLLGDLSSQNTISFAGFAFPNSQLADADWVTQYVHQRLESWSNIGLAASVTPAYSPIFEFHGEQSEWTVHSGASSSPFPASWSLPSFAVSVYPSTNGIRTVQVVPYSREWLFLVMSLFGCGLSGLWARWTTLKLKLD